MNHSVLLSEQFLKNLKKKDRAILLFTSHQTLDVMSLIQRLIEIPNDTNITAFLFWALLIGGGLYLFLPADNAMIGIFTGIVVALKLESNSLKSRINYLERKLTGSRSLDPFEV